MKRWLQDPRVHVRVLDQCQYGTSWRKRTRMVLGNIDELDTLKLGHMCRGSGGWCSRGRRHTILQGSSGHGDKTAQAAAYPRRLCTALVQALLSTARARRYNSAPHTFGAEGKGEGDGFLKELRPPVARGEAEMAAKPTAEARRQRRLERGRQGDLDLGPRHPPLENLPLGYDLGRGGCAGGTPPRRARHFREAHCPPEMSSRAWFQLAG